MVQNAITGEICLWSVQIHIYVCDHSYTHRLPINEIQYNSVRDWVRKFGGYWNFILVIHNFVQFTVKNRRFSLLFCTVKLVILTAILYCKLLKIVNNQQWNFNNPRILWLNLNPNYIESSQLAICESSYDHKHKHVFSAFRDKKSRLYNFGPYIYLI